MKPSELLTIAAKLVLSAVAIFAIAIGVVVLSGDGDVSEAEADVADIWPSGLLAPPDFQDVIEESGLEPKPYDHNGNLVKFAAGDTNYEPREVLDYFQHKFADAGINSKVRKDAIMVDAADMDEATRIMQSEEHEEYRHALLNGEVVPLYVADDYVAMGGIDPKVETEDAEEMVDQWLRDPHTGYTDFNANIDGFRFIDAKKDARTGRSTVTASWSGDDDFDADKSRNPESGNVGADVDVPACRGCVAVNRFAGLSTAEPYELNQYETRDRAENVLRFYSQAMPPRGWQRAESDRMVHRLRSDVPYLQRLRGEMNVYERDDEFVTIFVDRNMPGVTSVTALRGPTP